MDGAVDTGKCIYLEATHSEEEFMESGDSENPMAHTNSNYVCGHTGRANGPDFGPCNPAHCVRGRSCFRSRDWM